MFYRKVVSDMEAWSRSAYRKSLILRGVRQVGKTTAVRMFAEQFDTYIELNLEDEQDRELFITATDVVTLMNLIKLRKNISSTTGRVLLFIDEIQYSSNAMLSLRYFYERMPELFVIAAGSLLEAYLSKERMEVSVGRIEYLWVYPLDFDEYLQADHEAQLLDLMGSVPFPDYAEKYLHDQFNTFCTIGGMPEAVKVWIETQDIGKVRSVQSAIVQTYRDDVVKYTKSPDQSQVVLQIMHAAYFEIGRRITFEGFGQTSFKSLTVKNAFNLLSQVSLFHLLYPSTSWNIPLMPNMRKKPKLLAYDLGIVNYILGIQDKYYTEDSLHSIYKGNAMEQMVGQQLISMQNRHDFRLHFWVREARSSSAEVDFLISWQNRVIPIEVKAGKTGTMKSLFLFMQDSDSDIAVRLYDGKTKWERTACPNGKGFDLLHLNLGLLTRLFDHLPSQELKGRNPIK